MMGASKEMVVNDLVWPADVTDVPKEVFVRPDIFEQELKTFFYGPFWQPVAHEAELPNIGDFKTFDIGRVPLLIARGKDSKIRVFINSCSHRGNQVEVAPCGNRKQFGCPYHRWSFGTDGALIGCPGSEDFSPKFSKEDYGLKEIRIGSIFGLIFATLSDEAPDFDKWKEEVEPMLEKPIGHKAGLKFLGYQKVKFACNWKVYMDNDTYHAPLLHKGFRLLGWQSGGGHHYTSKSGHHGAEMQLKPAEKPRDVLKDPSLIDFKDATWDCGSAVFGTFPVTLLVKHLDVINIRFTIARSVDATEVHYAYFARADDSDEMAMHRARQSSNLIGPCGMISMEDAAMLQRLQIGYRSPGVEIFQKGIKDLRTIPISGGQNDEVTNLARWEQYRKLMRFCRAEH